MYSTNADSLFGSNALKETIVKSGSSSSSILINPFFIKGFNLQEGLT